MQTLSSTSVLASRGPFEAPGSVYIALPAPAQRTPASKAQGRRRMSGAFSQRFDATLTTLAMMGLLSPLVLGSALFVINSL
jgi:hypothetical protein